jgi:hypothetical protein
MNFFRLKRSIFSLIRNPKKIFVFKSYYSVYKNLFNPSKPYKFMQIKKKYEILDETFQIIENISDAKIKVIEIKKLYYLKKDKKFTLLSNLFKQNGTDKSNHAYDLIYIYLFKKFDYNFKKILEIGIGSRDLKIDGNMGYGAIPGASLLAFKKFFKKAFIYGADIDSTIKINYQGIKTFVVDQRSSKSLLLLSKKIKDLDLIIDDGLHLPNANLLTFSILSKTLAHKGIYVIEDIDPEFLKIYLIFGKLISSLYNIIIFKTKKRYLFVAIKKIQNQ